MATFKQCDNIYRPDYSESLALQTLLRMSDVMLDETSEAIDGELPLEHFTISVGGHSIDFIMGAPQYEAIVRFVEHIAGENLYAVDLNKLTVEGW